MHFEILVEDQSGKILIEALLPNILDELHTYRVIAYKGIGKLPRGMKPKSDAKARILLDQLPRLLKGYGRSLIPVEDNVVVVVLDCDRRDCQELKAELLELLEKIHPAPQAKFRIAVEEMEAWILGDMEAVRDAYPEAKIIAAEGYEQDSICGTWEVLADVVYPGGRQPLCRLGFPHTGEAKCNWAREIGPKMEPARNLSPSFRAFRDVFTAITIEGG